MRGPAQPARETLSEQYEGWMSSVTHPDMGVFRDIVKSEADRPLAYTEIENQVFSLFKETPDFAILKHDMVDTVGQLASLFDDVPVQAATIEKRLTEILDRATITADSSPQDFGNQKANVIHLTCLRLKQIAAITRQLKYSATINVDVKNYLGHVKDCVKNIAADYSVCGPGVVQKAEDEFSILRLKLFPPSIDRAVTETKDYLIKQVIINFCNEKYGFNDRSRNANAIPIGNQIHYVAAWQDRLIEFYPEFLHIPKNNDPHAPVLPYDGPHALLTEELKQHISHGATEVHACRFMAESAFQEIRSHLGEKVENINDNFSAFNEVLQQIQTRFPGLSADHFLQTDDLFSYEMRTDTDHLTLFLLSNLPEARFRPDTFFESNGLKFKTFNDLAWVESFDSDSGEWHVDFNLDPDSFFHNIQTNHFAAMERLVKLLPAISICLVRKDPADRSQFLCGILQKCFDANPFEQNDFLLENLQSQSDASKVIAACLYRIADTSFQIDSNRTHSAQSLLQWHDKGNEINRYFLNPDLIINLLINNFVSNNSVQSAFSLVLSLKNPDLAYRFLLASKAKLVGDRRTPAFLKINSWDRQASHAKREAKHLLKIPTYLAIKAAQSNEVGQELKSLKPSTIFKMVISGETEGLDFALRHGLNPNTVFSWSGLFNVRGHSLLQLSIDKEKIDIVRLLLNRGARREDSCLLMGRKLDARAYLQRRPYNSSTLEEIDALVSNFEQV